MTRRTSRGMTPTAAIPVPAREPEALGLGPGVADHERRAHRRRGEDGDGSTMPARLPPTTMPEVDDRLAPAIEDASP